MRSVNKERLLNTFLELVQIDSPSCEEAGVAAYCKQALEEAGCTVTVDDSSSQTGSDTGNLYAVLPAWGQEATGTSQQSKPLYFSAHMDTVGPGRGVKPVVKDGYIYSESNTILGSDDKAGIAAILELVQCLIEGRQNKVAHPEIRVLLSVQEEQGLIGVKAMDKAMFAQTPGALCFVLDAAGKPGLVVNGAPYQYTYRAQYSGLAAHAGIAPEKGISAIRAAAKAVAALPQGKIDEQTTTNVGTISGGTATNVVAEKCLVVGELRSHNLEKLLAVKDEIDAVFSAAAQDDLRGAGSAEVDIAWEVNYEGFYASKDSPQVTRALKAAKMIGLEPSTEISGGGADTNILAASGLAAVSLGCGMDRIHSTDERLAIEDLYDLTRWVLQIVVD